MTQYRFMDYQLDLLRRELRRGSDVINLQPKVFEVLALLVQNPGRALSKDDFFTQVWCGRFVTDNVLTRCIRQLRKVFQDDAGQPDFIRTVRGHGYQFVAKLAAVDPDKDAAGPTISVAVLPFQPLVSGQANKALEIGLADTLIVDLSRLRGLVVRPLNVVIDAMEGQSPVDPLKIGRNLAVSVVIDSYLQVAGERVRLSTRALRVVDGSALLAEHFEENISDLFEVQDQLCRRIVDALSIKLSDEAGPHGARRQTRHLQAYRAYCEGRLKLARHHSADIVEALADFEYALSLDENYVEALIGVAEANDLLATLGTEAKHYHACTRKAAERAIELDPERARAYTCLGKVAWQYEWDWEKAERLLRRATNLEPHDPEALIGLSDFLCYQGRAEEALEIAERAGEINPFSPYIQALIAQALHVNQCHQECIEQSQRAVELAPEFGFGRFFLALGYMGVGRYNEAVEQLQIAIEGSGRDDFFGVLGYALARSGDSEAARAVIKKLDEASANGVAVPPIAYAMIYAGLEEDTRVLEYFQRVLEQRSWHILLLNTEPAFATVRARPEGLALLHKLGLPAQDR